jgi:hypothetical protein
MWKKFITQRKHRGGKGGSKFREYVLKKGHITEDPCWRIVE